MTARDEALALLRERFPEPWAIEVVRLDSSFFVARAGTEPVERGPNPVRVYAEGDTAISAARACIAAWDDATKAEARVAELERKVVLLGDACPEQLAALNDVADAYEAARARVAVLAAECRAWREHNAYIAGFGRSGYTIASVAELAAVVAAARAATDANGGLDA